MKNWKLLLAFVSALAFASPVHAELSSLVVQFSKAAYTTGDTVSVTAASNGVSAQYKFQLDQVFGTGFIALGAGTWGTTATYQVKTSATALTIFGLSSAGIGAGQYRLQVFARENANQNETLVKTKYFTVTAPPTPTTVCDLLKGKTFTNATAVAPPGININCNIFTCIGTILNTLTKGIVQTTASNGSNLVSFTFGNGTVSVAGAPVSIITPFGSASASGSASGSYTCSGNTVNFTATGTAKLAGSSSLLSIVTQLPVSVSGSVTANSAGTALTAGTVTFK